MPVIGLPIGNKFCITSTEASLKPET